MKVAFFFGALNRGGAESLVYDVCKKKGIAPFEIACIYRKEGDLTQSFKETGVELLKVGQEGKNVFRFLLSFRKTVLTSRIDIVHAQTGFNALICVFSLLFTHVRIITTLHGFSFANAPGWQRRIVYRKSRRLICVSEFEKSFYQNKWRLPLGNKLCVVYNGIDFSKLDDISSDCPVTVDKDSLNMVMVGSFRSGRSQFFVCKVAKALSDGRIPFNLFFVGRREPSEHHRYDDCVDFCARHGLSDRVHFLGNRTDIPFLLKQMDLFIYASEHDTFGIAVLEAMASALPVLVNDWAVMKEITNGGEYATLYETDNVEDCVSKVISFLDKKATEQDTLENECQRVSRAVRERFSIENHIRGLDNVYSSCLN